MDDDLLPEYRVDYSKAKANRFAVRMSDGIVVVLEPDVAAVFKSAETVNRLLRISNDARNAAPEGTLTTSGAPVPQ